MADQPARKVGRPTLLTDDTQDRIVKAVLLGAYLDDAAAHAGITYRTLCKWVERGRRAEDAIEAGVDVPEGEERFVQFVHALTKARADAALRNIGVIHTAAQDGSWQAAAWYLERTNPKKWGRYDTVEIDGMERAQAGAASEITEMLDERIARMRERSKVIIEVTGRPSDEGTEGDTGRLSIAK